MTLPPDTLVGQLPYRIVSLLGKGTQGEVYEVLTPTGETYALKAVSTISNTAGIERFRREIILASSMRGAHAVPVVDHGRDMTHNLSYLVMPLFRLGTLESIVQRAPLAPEIAIELVVQVGLGVD